MSFTGHEDQKIKFEDGAELTKRYRDNNPSGCQLGEYFSKDSILELLNQPGCVGIRVYFGYDESKIFKLVVVGVDENEDDQIGDDYSCMDKGNPAPPYSGNQNILNS
ncbi:MAG: hypothetical protein U0X76_12450 [Bacteroidia bacterium]